MTAMKFSFGSEIKIGEVLQNIKTVEAQDYLKKIGTIKEKVEKFIDHKKRVCSGEFTSNILNEKEGKEPIPFKALTNLERLDCFKNVKLIEKALVENLYFARRKYLVSLHSERLLELEKIKEESIKDIDTYFKSLEKRRLIR